MKKERKEMKRKEENGGIREKEIEEENQRNLRKKSEEKGFSFFF